MMGQIISTAIISHLCHLCVRQERLQITPHLSLDVLSQSPFVSLAKDGIDAVNLRLGA